MKFNYLAVIVPRKWLPQNTEQARKQAWAAVTAHPSDYALCAVTLEMEGTK